MATRGNIPRCDAWYSRAQEIALSCTYDSPEVASRLRSCLGLYIGACDLLVIRSPGHPLDVLFLARFDEASHRGGDGHGREHLQGGERFTLLSEGFGVRV